MNNRKLRESGSMLRGSAKDLKDFSIRDSVSLEQPATDYSLKKSKRIHGVQLAPLNHMTKLNNGASILSQNRASVPLDGLSGHDKLTSAEMNSMALLHKEMMNAGQISPNIATKSTIPITAGLQKPPLQLDPIHHSARPSLRKLENTGPLSSVNFAERANRPMLDPICVSNSNAKSSLRNASISSTSRSGFTSAEPV